MTTIGLFEAKTKFSEICEEVSRKGETVVVTRRGRPLVKIEPIEQEQAHQEVWLLRESFDKKYGSQKEDFELPPRDIEKEWKNPLDD